MPELVGSPMSRCLCGHHPLAHHGERYGETDRECLYADCECLEYRPDPYCWVNVPVKWIKHVRWYSDGFRSGYEDDGRWNPVPQTRPNARKAWVAGKEAGKKARLHGDGPEAGAYENAYA